jgi:hypothetical protein
MTLLRTGDRRTEFEGANFDRLVRVTGKRGAVSCEFASSRPECGIDSVG